VNHARIKYWSPDAQLEPVKQRLKHLVAARRYNSFLGPNPEAILQRCFKPNQTIIRILTALDRSSSVCGWESMAQNTESL